MKDKAIYLQYWNGKAWIPCGHFWSEFAAWISLGGDNRNYRTVDALGNVLTDKSFTRRPAKENK